MIAGPMTNLIMSRPPGKIKHKNTQRKKMVRRDRVGNRRNGIGLGETPGWTKDEAVIQK